MRVQVEHNQDRIEDLVGELKLVKMELEEARKAKTSAAAEVRAARQAERIANEELQKARDDFHVQKQIIEEREKALISARDECEEDNTRLRAKVASLEHKLQAAINAKVEAERGEKRAKRWRFGSPW